MGVAEKPNAKKTQLEDRLERNLDLMLSSGQALLHLHKYSERTRKLASLQGRQGFVWQTGMALSTRGQSDLNHPYDLGPPNHSCLGKPVCKHATRMSGA